MTREDYAQLSNALDENWPKKFKDADVQAFCERLDRYPIGPVLSALTEWKNSKIWPPKIQEVLERLRGEQPRPVEQRYRTVIAQGVAKSNPDLDGRPEAELILRYHRNWLTWDARHPKTGHLTRFAFDSPEVLARLPAIKHQVVCDLIAAGWENEHAEDAAQWVGADKPTFDAWAASLQSVVQEVPEFV